MSKVIVYPNNRGGIAIVYPAINCGISLEEIARKDVPSNVPYLLIDESTIPTDYDFFEAFEADFSSPYGYGVGAQAWFIEQYEAELATLSPETDQARIIQLNQQIAIQKMEVSA